MGVITHFCYFSAFAHVVLLAVDRFIAVMFLFYYQANVTRTTIKRMVFVYWTCNVILTGIQQLFIVLRSYGLSNIDPYITFQWVDIVVYITMCTALCILQGKITLTARKVRQGRRSLTRSGPHTSSGNLVLLWLPYYVILILMARVENDSMILEILMKCAVLFGYVNSAINPIMYGLNNRKYRLAYKLLLCKKTENMQQELLAISH